MQTIKQSIITIIVCVAVVAGVSLVYSWTGPTAAPPGGNVAAPINVSSVSQYKSGALSIGGLLQTGAFQLTTGAATGKVLTSDASGLASWQTGGTGGVSQIIAGTNITISPTTGTGAVTINSTGGAGGLTGSGSTNYISKWTGSSSLGNSSVIDYGSYIQIGALKFGLNSAVGSGPAFTVANNGITTAVRTDNFNVINSSGSGYSNAWANDYYIGAIGKWASQLVSSGGSYLPLAGGTMNSGAVIDNAGRMHIASQENIYLLARGGNTYVSSAWGGAGNLNIDGQICLKGNCISSWPGGGGGGGYSTYVLVDGPNSMSINVGVHKLCSLSVIWGWDTDSGRIGCGVEGNPGGSWTFSRWRASCRIWCTD